MITNARRPHDRYYVRLWSHRCYHAFADFCFAWGEI